MKGALGDDEGSLKNFHVARNLLDVDHAVKQWDHSQVIKVELQCGRVQELWIRPASHARVMPEIAGGDVVSDANVLDSKVIIRIFPIRKLHIQVSVRECLRD